MGFFINPYVYASAYTARTQAFATATGITDLTILGALNTLDLGLISNSIDTKMLALYPMVGGSATTHKYNFMDARDLDAAFRLTFSGGWTHSSTGALPNGTTAYANTFLNSNTNLDLASNHMSYYSRTNNTTTAIDLGVFDGSAFYHMAIAVNTAIGGASGITNFAATADGRGYWVVSKRASNDRENYRNGTSDATNTTSDSTAFPNKEVYLGARNVNGVSVDLYSPRECALATIGSSLTDTDVSNLYTLVNDFQTTLPRNV